MNSAFGNIWCITKRELSGYFNSPVAYVFIVIFLLFANFFTFMLGQLFERGICHTVEIWDGGKLIGGLYGLSIGAAFFGESMFHRATGASKVALAHLVERLKIGGYRLLDTQFMTDHLRTFGGIEIAREDYELRLGEALRHQGDFRALDRSRA